MKVSEALQILQSVHPDSEVTIRLGKVLSKAEPYTPVPIQTGSVPMWVGPHNPNPYTITCNTMQ